MNSLENAERERQSRLDELENRCKTLEKENENAPRSHQDVHAKRPERQVKEEDFITSFSLKFMSASTLCRETHTAR